MPKVILAKFLSQKRYSYLTILVKVCFISVLCSTLDSLMWTELYTIEIVDLLIACLYFVWNEKFCPDREMGMTFMINEVHDSNGYFSKEFIISKTIALTINCPNIGASTKMRTNGWFVYMYLIVMNENIGLLGRFKTTPVPLIL